MHHTDDDIQTARRMLANANACAQQPALRAWACHVVFGVPLKKLEHDQAGDAPTLTDLLSRTETARVARIQAHAKRLRLL